MGSSLTVTSPACASPKPWTASWTTAFGSLMSFFMAVLLAVLLKDVFFDPTTGIAGGGRFLRPGFSGRVRRRRVPDAAKGQPPMTVPSLRPPTYRPPVVYPSIRVKPRGVCLGRPQGCLKGADHPGVAQGVRLDPRQVQEFSHTFVVRTQKLRIHLRVHCGLVRHHLEPVAFEEV